MTLIRLGAAAAALVLLAGCTSIPADPDHTLEDVRSTHVLRVGASPADGFVDIENGEVSGGSEVALAQRFAERLGAKVEWQVEGEEHLFTALEDGELDMVIGGLTKETPWETKAGLTRPYREDRDAQGRTRKHVMAVPLGENAMLTALERFLDEEGDRG